MRIAPLLVGCFALVMGAGEDPVKGPPAAPPIGKSPAASKMTLNVGDLAPAITADAWINGAPIPRLETGKVYIVEFWATWCGPCVKNIPHLNEIQRKNPAVTVIGVAASEPMPRSGFSDQREPIVRAFIARQGDAMRYRIAYDSRQASYNAWMTASGNATIPKTFLIGADGKIAWIGHPDDLEPELKKVLSPSAAAKPAPPPTKAAAPAPPTKPAPRLRPLP